MNAKEFLRLCVSSTAIFAAAAFAQEDVETDATPDAAADEAITVLDQTVPVSDDPVEPGPPEAAEEDEEAVARRDLTLAFERFGELRGQGMLDEAENVAKQVIELSIRLNGRDSIDTAKALNNLGVVQHQSGNYEAAALNFEQAINIIRDLEDQLSDSLINPLKGLGAAQLAGGRPDLARGTYTRAMHISHVNEGPHNLSQVDILESLAETNLRLGEIEDARALQDTIYGLHLRYYEDNAIEMVAPLMRLARWQHRTGYVLDERATYRRILRIIEHVYDDGSLSLVEPLMLLGQSYYYADQSQSTYVTTTSASGEIYFKRAVRIAEDNPNSTWDLVAETKLELADYYTFRADLGRARKHYREVWELLSADPTDEARLALRREELEETNLLVEDTIPRYVGGASVNDTAIGDGLREGRVMVSYNITARGRVTGLQIVEATPNEFEDMQRLVSREVRARIYRPRFEDALPVETPNQSFTHSFYFLQEALDELRAEADGT